MPVALHLYLDLAVEVQVPVEAVVVVADSDEGRDDEAVLAAHRTLAREHVRVLPERAKVLFVDANHVLELEWVAKVVDHRRVQVVDLAETVAAEHERVGEAPKLVLARVKVVLPVVRWLWLGVRHDHLGDQRAVEDLSLAARVLERNVVPREPLAAIEADAHFPVLPRQHVVLDGEARVVRLRDVERLHGRAHRTRDRRVQVIARFLRHVHVARVREPRDAAVGQIDVRDDALDRMRVHRVRVFRREEAEHADHAQPDFVFEAKDASRERCRMHDAEVRDTALRERHDVASVRLGDLFGRDVVLVEDRTPAVDRRVQLAHVHDTARWDVDDHLTGHIRVLVEEEHANLTWHGVAAAELVERGVVGLAQHHVRVPEAGVHVARFSEDLLLALHLIGRDRV